MITLGIIGVVAALTMPALINKTNNKELVAALKKAYSTLSQATTIVSIDNPPKYWGEPTVGDLTSRVEETSKFYNLYKPYLKIVKDCGCAEEATGCWSKDATRTLNGQIFKYGHSEGIGNTYCAVRLADGMNISFDTVTKSEFGYNPTYEDMVYFFYVDVNGDKKPNTLGKDVFLFIINREKGVLAPNGSGTDYPKCTENDNSNLSGLDCAAKVLNEGKISY